ncbi:MAG: FAD-binding oxidoreductase [Actinomycetes bacterium]
MIGRYDDTVARWGVAPKPVEVSPRALEYLAEYVGESTPRPATGRANLHVAPSALDADVRERIARIVGDDAVVVDDDTRLAHAGGFAYSDLMQRRGTGTKVADAVVYPTTHDEVQLLLGVASEANVAVVPFGGGTSVVGGVRAEAGGRAGVIAIAFDRMASMIALDDVNMTATVGPGMTGPTLERLLRTRGLTLGHFPQSWERASIGGYVATRSAGQNSAGYGRSNDMVERLRVATPRGEFRLGRAPGSAAGPDLRQLFIGSEGAFGIVTEVTLRIRRNPAVKRYEGVIFPTYEAGLGAMREMVVRQARADMMRLSDPEETRTNLTMAVDGLKASALDGYLSARRVADGSLAILGWEGSRVQVSAHRDESWRAVRKFGGVSLGQMIGDGWEHSRFSGPYLRDTLMDAGYLVETLETATGWRELPALRDAVFEALRGQLSDGGPGPLIMSHLSHVYETGGSLYVTVVARADAADPVGQWHRAKTAACDVLVANGATITHHHAVGRDHQPWMVNEVGQSGVDLLEAIKAYLDPHSILNPGVLIG